MWLDKISIWYILIFAILFGLAPFQSEPHLWQKIRMLIDGSLSKPIDIFDLFMHGLPALFFIVKSIRMIYLWRPSQTTTDEL
jgi:SPX domain protein involved in polyphosphate accumulation